LKQLDPAGHSALLMQVGSVLQARLRFAQIVPWSTLSMQVQLGLVDEQWVNGFPLQGPTPDWQVPAVHVGGQAGHARVPPQRSGMMVPHWSGEQVVSGVQPQTPGVPPPPQVSNPVHCGPWGLAQLV
jgi:hypothetical protein